MADDITDKDNIDNKMTLRDDKHPTETLGPGYHRILTPDMLSPTLSTNMTMTNCNFALYIQIY